jgi:hypothetical protein
MTDRARRGAVRGAPTRSGSTTPGAIAPPPLMRRSRTFWPQPIIPSSISRQVNNPIYAEEAAQRSSQTRARFLKQPLKNQNVESVYPIAISRSRHISPRLARIYANRQSYQNVSREAVRYDQARILLLLTDLAARAFDSRSGADAPDRPQGFSIPCKRTPAPPTRAPAPPPPDGPRRRPRIGWR